VEEQGGDTLQEGGDRAGPRRVALDDLDIGGQAGDLRVAGDGADLGALADDHVDEGTSDVAGRSGYQNQSTTFPFFVQRHRLSFPESGQTGPDGLDLSDEQSGWRTATSGPEIPAF
jgi:hypothetical protein